MTSAKSKSAKSSSDNAASASAAPVPTSTAAAGPATGDAAALTVGETSGARPRRSALYMPGSKDRAMEKAKTLAADCLIFDLEDSVAPAEKAAARERVAAALVSGAFAPRETVMRINGLETPWGVDDLKAAARAAPDAVLVPKVNAAEQVQEIDALLTRHGAPESVKIWAMMETPRGALHAESIAASTPRLTGFVMGTNDLLKELGGEQTDLRLPAITALGLCLLAARAYGLAVIDGVFNAFSDADGFRAACRQSKEMGFDGRTLIHPKQIPIANEAFAYTTEELDLAERQVEAYEAAIARGDAVAVVDGKIVENLHVETARSKLAQAQRIAELEAALK